MDRISSKLVIAIACAILLSPPILPAEPAGAVEVGTHSLLIQGFEAADVLEEKPHVSYLSGVPEDAEVEVWDNALYRRKRIPHRESGIVCEVSSRHKKQGAASLRVKFTRDDRVLRVSLRNNINQPSRDGVRPACNSIGCFDRLVGDIFNPIAEPVAVRLRMLGGFAVTDKAATFSLVRNLTLKPGWNEFSVSSQEASATFVDPHDATCVEFCVPAARGQELYFDNFRMERETIGKNLAKYAKCFDFGVAHFNWPGFAYGSVGWDEQRGYGFTRGERLTHGGDLHVINDQLTRDGFEAPASFRVKLPNGAYKVVCQTGNYWAQRDGGLNIEIRAEGKRVYYRPRMSGREYLAFKFAHENTDHWKRDLDLWGTYDEGTYFRTVTFDTVVEDGALDLDFLLPAAEGTHGRSIWTYLIVYPAEKNKLIQPELTWLNEKIRTIYNKVSHVPFSRQFGLYNREEVICAEEFLWPDLAAARRRSLAAAGEAASRGYLHFLRHHHDLITPDSVPRPDETGDSIAVFGTPGETVQWAVGLYPLRDLKGVSISLGDFKDASGKTVIAGPEADVRLVSYRPMTPVTSNHAECFHRLGPGVLIPARPIDAPAGFPRRFWLSLPIPGDAPAGLYRGQVRFKVGGKPASTVRVALRVLPFDLEEPKNVSFAVDYRGTMSFRKEDGPAELKFFRGLGMNTLWYRGDRQRLPEMRRLARQEGLRLEIGSPDKYANWRWPREYREELIRRRQARGKAVSFQPRHTGHREGRKIRFTHGFWLWRSGIRHRVVQTQANAAERVYYAHYGHAKFGPCSYLFPSLAGPGRFNPAPTLYEVQDGIYDWRYIQTLVDLVKSAEGDGRRARELAEAKACLEALSESINPNLDHYYFERKRHFNHVGRFGLHDTVWNGRRYQLERWELARQISALCGKPLRTHTRPVGTPNPDRVVHFREYFGPFWVEESQFAAFNHQRQGEPTLQAETPKTPVGRNWATVLVKMRYPSEASWVAVLRDSAGKELARERVGTLQRWKTRWVLETAGLPVGSYTLHIVRGGGDEASSLAETDIRVVPRID